MAAYATSADLIKLADSRTIGRLVSDDGSVVSESDLASNAKITEVLLVASGEVDAALLTGDRYSAANLSGLTGNAASLLKAIVCDVAMQRLFMRRPGLDAEMANRYHEVARSHLDRLRKGEDVFDLESQQAKRHPTIDGPTATDYETLNLMPERCYHYYPHRADRLPTDRH